MVGIVVCEPMGCVVGVTDSPAQAQDRAEELAFRSEDLEGWMIGVVVPAPVRPRGLRVGGWENEGSPRRLAAEASGSTSET